jgi:hypothetical protein
VVVKLPVGVVTVIGPLVAPAGTFTNTPWLEGTCKAVAAVLLKLTAVAPSRFVPHSSTASPTAPARGLKDWMRGLGGGRPASSEGYTLAQNGV